MPPRATRRNTALPLSDWVKMLVVLAAALAGFAYTYSVYTEPFDLTAEIARQRLVQEYETTSPLVRQIPTGGGGPPAQVAPQR